MAKNVGFTAFLARRATSEAAHAAVLSSGLKYPIEQLALNPAISESTWYKLAAIKNNVYATQNLVKRTLPEEKLRLLLKDPRISIRELLFTGCLASISLELAQELANSKLLTKRTSAWWLDAGTVPRSLLTKVSLTADGHRLAHHLSDPELFTTEQVLEVLSKLSRDYLIRAELRRLFDIRPELIKDPRVLGIDHLSILDALAGCRHIFDQEYFRAILAKVTVTQKVMSRTKLVAAPRDPLLVRDILLELMDNPNSSPEVAELAYSALPRSVYLDMPAFKRYQALVNNRETKVEFKVDWSTLSVLEQKALLFGRQAKNYPTLAYVKSLLVEKVRKDSLYKEPKATRKDLAVLKVMDFYLETDLPQSQLIKEIQTPLDAKGPLAWGTLLALAPEWQLSIQNLVGTTISLVA